MGNIQKFYRYEIVEYAFPEGDGDVRTSIFTNLKIKLREYDLFKETPKGYWIKLYTFGDDIKWVSKSSKKRFAYPTKKEALNNLIKRTQRRLELLKHQELVCIRGLNDAKELINTI